MTIHSLSRMAIFSSLALVFMASIGWSAEDSRTQSNTPSDVYAKHGPACFPETDHIRQIVERRFMDRVSSVGVFMRSTGLDRVRKDDIRLLADEDDWTTCMQLNILHGDDILETQGRRGMATSSEAPYFDVVYYQVSNLYVAIVREAAPVSAIDGIDVIRIGGPTLITIYSKELDLLFSPRRR